jgi:hypothetical protein
MKILAIPAHLRALFLKSVPLRTCPCTALHSVDVLPFTFLLGQPLFISHWKANLPMSVLMLRMQVAAQGLEGAIENLRNWRVRLATFADAAPREALH